MQEEEINVAGIATLLKLSYSGDTSAIQKQAEKKLEAASHSQLFLPVLQAIVLEQSIAENVRSAAALYLSKECKTLSARGKELGGALLLVVQLLESAVEMSLKRHVCNALKNLIYMQSAVRLELFSRAIEKIKGLLAQQEMREFQYESMVLVAIALLQTSGATPEERQALFAMVPIMCELGIKTTAVVQETLLNTSLQALLARRVQLMREFGRMLTHVVRLVSVDEDPELAALFCIPSLNTLFVDSLQLRANETGRLFSHHQGPVSALLNEFKHHVVYSLDLMLRKINKFSPNRIAETNLLTNCSTVTNLPQFCQLVLSEVLLCLKQKKYYELATNAVSLLDISLKLLRTCLKMPALESLFGACRKELLFGVIIPLLEFNPEEEETYTEAPDDFVAYVFGIANRQEAEEDEDDEWQMQITVATLMHTFCSCQHGTLNELFEFALNRLASAECQPIETKVLLMVIAILRDLTKERTELHQKLKSYLEGQFATLLQHQTSNDQLIIRAMKLYLVHKYNFFLSKLNQSFLGVSAQLALTIIQTQDLRDDQVLQIIALEILSNICNIGEIVMADSAEQTLRALIPLIQRPVNHRLFDALQQIVSSYDEKLSDEAITQCVHQLVCKIESETLSRSPPMVSNKCWNIIRVIGDNDYFIPRLIAPIETQVLRLQKYLQVPDEVEFEEDFLLLCTAFIKRCKKITTAQLSLFECFAKIFERYHFTFGHMFETMSYFIFYGSDILKQAPKAIEYAVGICLKAITTPESAKSNESDQAQGVLLLQSLLVCCSEAFSLQSLRSVVETIRQRLQLGIKHEFLRGNLLAALGLVLVRVWSGMESGQTQLLLTMLVTGAAVVKDAHCVKLLILTLSELLGLDDPVVQARMPNIIEIIVVALNRKTKAVPKNDDEIDNAKVEFDLAMETYKDPTSALNEYIMFKARFEQLRQRFPQQIAFAVAQLPAGEQDFVKSLLKMEEVAGKARVKLSVRRPEP